MVSENGMQNSQCTEKEPPKRSTFSVQMLRDARNTEDKSES